MDDLDRERARRLTPLPPPSSHRGGGSAAFVGQVVTPPTDVGQFFTVNPVSVGGTETAGGAGTLTVDSSTTVPVYLVGRRVPDVGDNLVCTFVDYRWVAEIGGCPLVIEPRDGYGNPIVGAQVTVYWYAPTRGAFLDPSKNDHSVGPFTTTGVALSIPVDGTNGIYMVKVVAAGYVTTYKFVWACDGHCNPATSTTSKGSFGPLGGQPNDLAGFFVNFPPYTDPVAPYLTGVSLSTNVQTTPLVATVVGGITLPNSSVNYRPSTAYVPISGTYQYIRQEPTDGAFTGNADSISGGVVSYCNPLTGRTPGWVHIACESDGTGIHVVGLVYLKVCPAGAPGTRAEPPTGYGAFYAHSNYGNMVTGVLGSTVKGIEYSPFKVTGTWDAAYKTYPWTVNGVVEQIMGSHPRGNGTSYLTQPDPSLIPLSGDFTIS